MIRIRSSCSRKLKASIVACIVAMALAGPTNSAEASDIERINLPPLPACPHRPLLLWGLSPDASDRLRCAGKSVIDITQTIGHAAASEGTHEPDGFVDGAPYCAAVDLGVGGLSESEVHGLLDKLARHGFVAFFRNPGHDSWPSTERSHIHAIYAGVRMKEGLRQQVRDWLSGRNGLEDHGIYRFYRPSSAQRELTLALFNQHNRK
jgi:hypothetical protein